MIDKKEKQLIKRIINKEEKAFLIIYRQYHKLVYRYIAKKINDHRLAEELTQDVFFELIEALRDFRFQSCLKTFIFSIARNKTIDHIRKKKIKNILFSAIPDYVVEGLKTILFDEDLEKKELNRKIEKTLMMLPNDYRRILRQKYIEGEKISQIAERFKLKIKATESLLFRARKAFVRVFNHLP